jgi:hypothetical protein
MKENQRAHRTGRPSAETAQAAWSLLVSAARRRRRYPRVGDLDLWQKPADAPLVVALDAAILAGEDGRMLSTNLVFDALAARLSDTYRAAIDSGPARISYEMHPDVLDASLQDLRSHGLTLVRLGTLLKLVQHGCGLYRAERVPERGYTVDLTDEKTEELRTKFVEILAGDRATSGDYRRRGSKKRLLLAGDNEDRLPFPADDSLDDGDGTDADANYKVVFGWKYNVAVPGPESNDIIRRLKKTRLYLDVATFKKEFEDGYEKKGRLVQRRDEIDVELWDTYKVDVAKSPTKPRGGGRSARQWGMAHLKKRDAAAVKSLIEEYDDIDGQIRQMQGVCQQLREIDSAPQEIEIRSRYYKVSNRRYQNADFWPPEVSGEDATKQNLILAEPLGRFPGLSVDTTRRGRLFLVAATRPRSLATSINRLRPLGGDPIAAGKRVPLVGVDVSSSQVQILAVFLGLSDLEALFTGRRYWDIVAERAWERDQDTTDDFSLPQRFEGPRDPKLQAAFKKAVMTWLYNSSLESIVDTLDSSPSEYGPGLGSKANLSRLLHDEKLKLRVIDDWFKPACRAIAQQAWEADPYITGLTFTDPFDKVVFRWNPIHWRSEVCAGSGHFKIYSKVPYMEWRVITGWKKNGSPRTRLEWFPAESVNGDYPVDRAKLGRSIAPCLTHMLDSAFAGFVIRRLNELGVRDVVSIHDAFLVAEEAEPLLRRAVKDASRPWLECLGPVYDDLTRYLGQDVTYGDWVRRLRQQWADRVARHDWPEFRVGDVALVSEIQRTYRAGRIRNT